MASSSAPYSVAAVELVIVVATVALEELYICTPGTVAGPKPSLAFALASASLQYSVAAVAVVMFVATVASEELGGFFKFLLDVLAVESFPYNATIGTLLLA